MFDYFKNLVRYLIGFVILILLAFINWLWPLYVWFGNSALIRFLWLGIFFIILDFVFEIISGSLRQIRLMIAIIGFSKDIHKISGEFHIVSKFILPNKASVDHIVIGSSGVWLITVKDGGGKISFSGDELMQNGTILGGLITKSLEKAYSLSSYIKENLGRDMKVAPVIAFSSSEADLLDMPRSVRGVFISSRKDTVPLVENTDFQLVDKKTIEEIYNILKK